MENAKRGAVALEASDAHTALNYYTKALIQHPTSPDYFTQRSTAFSRLKPARHDLALRDAEYAVLLGQQRQKREKIQAAQQRRVVSLYGLGRYEEAKQILNSMLRWRPKESKKDKMEHDMWDARIMSRLKSNNVDDHAPAAIKEYPEVDLPDEKTMKMWLESQLHQDETYKFDNEHDPMAITSTPNTEANIRSDTNNNGAQEEVQTKAAREEIADQQALPVSQPIRHDWYQDNNSVTVTFYAKKVDKTKLHSDISNDHVTLSFPHPEISNGVFTFALDPTFASINASSSVAKVFGTKVELKLAKQDRGIKWPALDDKSRPKPDKLPSAWTTKGDQDWDKKTAELTKKQSKKEGKKKGTEDSKSDSDGESDFGGDAVDGFFKKLYSGADDDTRRAMMKSFQESNGTALSTNWAEVSKGKVEEVKSKSDD